MNRAAVGVWLEGRVLPDGRGIIWCAWRSAARRSRLERERGGSSFPGWTKLFGTAAVGTTNFVGPSGGAVLESRKWGASLRCGFSSFERVEQWLPAQRVHVIGRPHPVGPTKGGPRVVVPFLGHGPFEPPRRRLLPAGHEGGCWDNGTGWSSPPPASEPGRVSPPSLGLGLSATARPAAR